MWADCLLVCGYRVRRSVLPDGVPVLSVEAASAYGWERYSHAHIGVNEFGRSAPYQLVYEYFGITPDGVAAKATRVRVPLTAKVTRR